MTKISLYTIILLLYLSCKTKPKQYITHLSGYWEIVSVTLPDGTKKNYTINPTIDYIDVEGMKGIRKKLKPNLSGIFTASKHQDNFTVLLDNDSLHLHYTTPFSNWKESVLKATTSTLLVSRNKTLYLYKRYTPIIKKNE